MKLYVGNLSFNTSDQDLSTLFGEVGTVQSTNIIQDRETGRSRGFGFVEMSSKEEGQKAIATLHGKEIDGRELKVNEAKPQENRGGGGGGGRGGTAVAVVTAAAVIAAVTAAIVEATAAAAVTAATAAASRDPARQATKAHTRTKPIIMIKKCPELLPGAFFVYPAVRRTLDSAIRNNAGVTYFFAIFLFHANRPVQRRSRD